MSIGIITVSFNSAKTIETTILSVLNQTLPPYEYFIIDGGSDDTTLKIAQKYKNAFKNKGIKYRIISERDAGMYDAMNKGIDMSSSDIIGIINSDDWYEVEALEQIKKRYDDTLFDMCYGDLRIVRKNGGSLIKRSRIDKFVTSRNWNHPTTFISKNLYKKFNYDYLSEPGYADFDLFLRLRKEKVHIEIINKVLANFRVGGVSTSQNFVQFIDGAKRRYKIYRRHGYRKIYFIECYLTEFAKYIYYALPQYIATKKDL